MIYHILLFLIILLALFVYALSSIDKPYYQSEQTTDTRDTSLNALEGLGELHCSNCDNWDRGHYDSDIQSDLKPCLVPHKVDLYGGEKIVTLLTEASFVCPKWEEIDNEEEYQEKLLRYSPFANGLEPSFIEDDHPQEWAKADIRQFNKILNGGNDLE